MPVLVLDTASTRTVVGVVVDGHPAAVRRIVGGHAAQHALAAVDDVLAEAGVTPDEIARIAVGCGPGSFTGLRIGIATAQGLGTALGVPVDGVSTLAALDRPDAIALIDARRGEVFTAADGLPPGAYAPSVLERLPPSTLIGDGALRHAELLRAMGHTIPADDDPRHTPDPLRLATIAGGAVTEALYLRAPDAVPTEART